MIGDCFELLDLWRRQAALAGGYATMAPFAGFVAAHRMTRMALETGNPSAAGARETERMVSEKMSAVFEGGAAATRILGGLAGAASPLAVAGMFMSAGEAVLKPVSRTVHSNARRLSRAR